MRHRRVTHAWVGRKPCGCPTFARLAIPFRALPLEKAAKGLEVRRVPVADAAVVVCRCA
jgi:hypothetical protein